MVLQHQQISGSTTMNELLLMFPDGSAAQLMSSLGWACAHCAVRQTEPLSLAAKRHGNNPRQVVEVFRALVDGVVDSELLSAAQRKHVHRGTSWEDYAV